MGRRLDEDRLAGDDGGSRPQRVSCGGKRAEPVGPPGESIATRFADGVLVEMALQPFSGPLARGPGERVRVRGRAVARRDSLEGLKFSEKTSLNNRKRCESLAPSPPGAEARGL